MSAKPISYKDVAQAADALKMRGEKPSITNVAEVLANVGFNHEIGTWLEQWYQTQPEFERSSNEQDIDILSDVKEKHEELKKNISLVRATLESTADGILIINSQGQVVDWNVKFTKMWRLPVKLLEAGPESLGFEYVLDQVCNPQDLVKEVERLYQSPEAMGELGLLYFKDGRIFERYSQPQKIADQIVGRVWSFRDVTAWHMAKQELETYARVAEVSKNGVFIVDNSKEELPIIYVNPAFCSMLNLKLEEVVGLPFRSLDALGDRRCNINELAQKIKKGFEETIVLSGTDQKKERFWAEVQLRSAKDQEKNIHHGIGIMVDITHRKSMEDKLRNQARHDGLTGLPNRSYLIEIVSNLINNNGVQEKFALVFIDLDHFKMVNDSLGHSIGDEILKLIGNRLVKSLRSNDMVARLGGDEFVLILREADSYDSIRTLLNRAKDFIANEIRIKDYRFRITSSMGVSFYPLNGENFESLLLQADMAMYAAKDAGRDKIDFYQKGMKTYLQSRFKLSSELKNALKRREFRLAYQPLIDLKNMKIIGVEALLRWNNRELGEIPPSDFIPIAEESDIIIDIGDWVIEQSIRQVKNWHDLGFTDMMVAVNFSARQFCSTIVFDSIEALLKKYNFPPEKFEVELTETLLIQNQAMVLSTLEKLKAIGIRIAIDDFGTGYSSLAYLQHFPIDKLKIDRSFIWEMSEQNPDARIAKAILKLAHSLDMVALAEGVETDYQSDFLKRSGCDYGQGYLFSKPIAGEEITKLLKKQS